jgi:pantoate--beta-alanine ligase
MGALHEGHLSLVRRGRQDNETLAVSIFVNPTQFGSGEDLVSYPRDLDRDLGLLSEGGVDLVFTPAAEEIYPPGFDTWVDAGHLGEVLEGVHRPGHFRGVATVVTKLFNLMRPDRAYFGQKDGQQTVVIRQLVRDLALDVDLVVLPTVRQPDGLALSSRNVHLTPEQSAAAPVIYRVLCRAQETWQSGNREANSLRRLVVQMLETEPLVDAIEYVSVADGQSLAELEHVTEGAMVSLAVRVGQTRLIDNVILE